MPASRHNIDKYDPSILKNQQMLGNAGFAGADISDDVATRDGPILHEVPDDLAAGAITKSGHRKLNFVRPVRSRGMHDSRHSLILPDSCQQGKINPLTIPNRFLQTKS